MPQELVPAGVEHQTWGVRGPVPYPEPPSGAGETPPVVNPLGSPLRRGLRHVLPGLLHVLALVLIVCQSLPESGPLGFTPSLGGLTIIELGDDSALADAPKMARLSGDADDLREAFAAYGPSVLPIMQSMAAIDPAGTDQPRTREDHPPIRPPRRIA